MNVVPFRSRALPPGEAKQKIALAIQKMEAAAAELSQMLGPYEVEYRDKSDQRDVEHYGAYAGAVYDLRTLQTTIPRMTAVARLRLG